MNIDLALTGVKGPFPLKDVMNYQGSQGRYAKIQIIVSDNSFQA